MADPELTAAAPDLAAKKIEQDNRPLQPNPSSTATLPFPNPNTSGPPPSSVSAPHPSSVQPSFRPAAPLVPVPSAAATPQFLPGTYQAHGIPPPGVISSSAPAVGGVALPQIRVGSVQTVITPNYAMAGQPMRYVSQVPNGYPAMPQPVPQRVMPPPGILRYPSTYAPMIRPAFPPRPLVGVMPPIACPPVVGIRGPVIPPIVRPPIIPVVLPAEKPQTTVYVGKISSTVENDFILSLLQLCGPVKSWKRPQDPTGALKGFGFCEFESAEGVLRAMRLLSKLNVDGQELMLNVNQNTREYLVRYVERKIGSSKNNKLEPGSDQKEDKSGSVAVVEETAKSSEESPKSSLDERKKDDTDMENKVNPDSSNFGLVTEEDREADRESHEKLTSMIEERLRSKPLPPPPPPPPLQTAADGPSNSNSEQPSGLTDKESDGGVAKNDLEDKNEDEKTAESRPSSENDRAEMVSPDRSRRHDRSRDRDRDRDHDLRREKERELERYEREREQERAKREKEREHKSWEDERRYKAREKEWEAREREKEHRRKREREREKEKAQERKWEIIDQERDNDDGYGKKRKYRVSDEERKRRQREKEDDLADRLREEEEIAEAKIKAQEEQQKEQHETLKIASGQSVSRQEKDSLPEEIYSENQNKATEQAIDQDPNPGFYEGEGVSQNGISYETVIPSVSAPDARQNSNAPAKKLGFGLSGSGKRAAVPSVFYEDEDEDAHKDKKMRPLVPIDYSTEEQQAVQSSVNEGPSGNVLAVPEFAKRISNVNTKEEMPDVEKEKWRRFHDRSSQRDRDRHGEETYSTREEGKKDSFDRERASKRKTPENFLDAKQLIDIIPKTKDELFSYYINWTVYDKNALHERMRPWISKKIMDFLGEEEVTLVDYIVSSIQEHVDAGEMLDRLQAILDDEAEMFVLKMWRMLIFEIKRVETGLALRSKT